MPGVRRIIGGAGYIRLRAVLAATGWSWHYVEKLVAAGLLTPEKAPPSRRRWKKGRAWYAVAEVRAIQERERHDDGRQTGTGQ